MITTGENFILFSMVNDEPPKKIVENLFSTLKYIERNKIMFHIFSSIVYGATQQMVKPRLQQISRYGVQERSFQ